MPKNKMYVILSPGEYSGTKKNQNVNFVNIFSSYNVPRDVTPTEISYDDFNKTDNSFCFLNYSKIDGSISEGYDSGITTIEGSYDYPIDVFKQEVEVTKGDNGEEVITPLTSLQLVCEKYEKYSFSDYNISNDRTYQYFIYPTQASATAEGDNIIQRLVTKPIKTQWDAWSITELHPSDSTGKHFFASENDVWLFNLNVETGEQSQNISRQEQQTLGKFNRYSNGKMNYVSGSVTCLLGSEVVPAFMANKRGSGYQEFRKFPTSYTSNERIDMLKAWRELVFSRNPKLLKDRAGQSFIVTINSSANKLMDSVRRQPNTISFNWAQIGDTDDVTIVSK